MRERAHDLESKDEVKSDAERLRQDIEKTQEEIAKLFERINSDRGTLDRVKEGVMNGAETDLMYWQPRWGDVIRGPGWGTFLGAAHVERLGGVERIEREAPCARVIALRSGGAFLQATVIEAPLVEGRDDRGALARLAGFLAPVIGA